MRGRKSHSQKPKIKVDHIDDSEVDAITEYNDTGPQLQHDPLHYIHTKETSFADVSMSDDLATVSRRNINEETISNLDLSNIIDRFIQFLITKFEYLNLKQLSVLQCQEPQLANLVAKCKANPRKIYKLSDKKKTKYHYRQGLLIKSFISETELVRYQVALPQVAVVDLLIILHRKHSHLGREKLDAKFSENYFCFNLID